HEPKTAEKKPVKYSTMEATSTRVMPAYMMRPNHRKPLIIASGTKRRPRAMATQKTISGKRLRRISPMPIVTAWVAAAVVDTSGRISRPDSEIRADAMKTPIGTLRMPDMMPSAMYLWSALSSMARPTGIEKMMVAPDMNDTIAATSHASRDPASASASW